ncbi:hypothetical protein G7046_g640 [Stylonectria norvegica]|nr:hypothetical protein G7046_g640 [Stylonectria norvegica]
MGLLAEGKSRNKISKDPNNTKWSKDTTTFGQKILRASGWEPGKYLGAQGTEHAKLHTAANASYIRVAMKDDMKGLGFNRAKADEITGLDVFSDLLSRLNGKTEEVVEAEQQSRLAVKTNYYVEQRWGTMRFVRGGLLVGDKLQEEKDDEKKNESEVAVEDEPITTKESKEENTSRKRKATDDSDDSSSEESESTRKKRRKEERKSKRADKKDKKSKKSKSRSKGSDEVSDDEAGQSDERAKKRKSKSKHRNRSTDDSDDDATLKDSKKAAKKERREKKEKKRRRREAADNSDSDSAPKSKTASGTSTPSGTGTSTPQANRNFVRARFIAQKRQAMMDPAALNQVCLTPQLFQFA